MKIKIKQLKIKQLKIKKQMKIKIKKVLEEISNDEHERELAELRQKYIMLRKRNQQN